MSDYLPRDLQLQILKRLSVDTILKFRTVCKSWNSLITSDHFISAHLKLTKSINQNGNQTLLIRYYDQRDKYIIGKDDETFGLQFSNIELQYASEGRYTRVVGYCDGIMCLSGDLFASFSVVILWNPSIRKRVQVEIPNYKKTGPQTSVLGFGVCPMTHDPKIVRIVYIIDFGTTWLAKFQDPPIVEVFSLVSGAWRKSNGGNSPHKLIQITWSQVYINGVIHWIAFYKQIEVNQRCLIMSFDLVREVFDEMPLPDVLANQLASNLSVCNRKGYLTIVESDKGTGKESCGVWIMKEYGVTGSWEKLYIIRLPDFLRRFVGFRSNGDMVLALKNRELVFVDCVGNVKSVGIYANIRSFFLGSYMESLILINQRDRHMYINSCDDNS